MNSKTDFFLYAALEDADMSYHMLYTNISTFKRIFPTYRYEITYEKKQETYERTNIKKYLTRFLDR